MSKYWQYFRVGLTLVFLAHLYPRTKASCNNNAYNKASDLLLEVGLPQQAVDVLTIISCCEEWIEDQNKSLVKAITKHPDAEEKQAVSFLELMNTVPREADQQVMMDKYNLVEDPFHSDNSFKERIFLRSGCPS